MVYESARGWVVDADVCFSYDETRALMTSLDDADESVRHGIQNKLLQLGEPTTAPLLSRNLKALLNKRIGARP